MDEFTRQYIETMLWSSNDENDTPLDENYNIYDLSGDLLKEIIEDCTKFQADNKSLVETNYGQAGHDFWLTRNHHGAGFWDSDCWSKEIGIKLTENAHTYNEVYLYISDGKVCV